MNRLVAWWVPARIMGATAIVAGIGLIVAPDKYVNPSYRVLFHSMTARQGGIAWVIVGLCAMTVRPWAIALIGSALIAWGLGFAAAAWIAPRAGSPLGWVWFPAWGVLTLRHLATGASAQRET